MGEESGATYHAARGRRDAQLDALSALAGVAAGEQTKVTHAVIDRMVGRDTPVCVGGMAEGQVAALAGALDALVIGTAREGLDEEKVLADLAAAGVQDAGHVASAVTARRGEVQRALAAKSAQISTAHLADFDWTLKSVLAGNTAAGIRQPVVQLALYVQRGGKRERVLVEVTRRELAALIRTLDEVEAALHADV